MPSRSTVEAFVKLVEAGDYVGAIEQFYAADASTRENAAEPVVGRDALVAKERGVMASFARIEASRIGPSLIDGDSVAAGQQIAMVGMSGLTTGPHLHFEVLVRGRSVDPIRFLASTHDSSGAAIRAFLEKH